MSNLKHIDMFLNTNAFLSSNAQRQKLKSMIVIASLLIAIVLIMITITVELGRSMMVAVHTQIHILSKKVTPVSK